MSAFATAGLAALGVLFAALALEPRLRRPTITRSVACPRVMRRWPRLVALTVAALSSTLVAGVTVVALLAATVALAGWWRGRRRRGARRHAIDVDYPDAIDLVVVGIRSGLLPAAALATAATHLPTVLRAAFERVADRSAAGERFADALTSLPELLGDIARPMIDSFAAAERYGLPLAPVLERLADEARARRRRTAEATARQLPVRLAAPLVVCTLPSFVLLAIVPLLVGAFSSWHGP